MTSRDFCYWLMGRFELGEAGAFSAEQTAMVKAHLAMVFKHEIDPSMGTDDHRAELQRLHDRRERCAGMVGSRRCTLQAGHEFRPGEPTDHKFDMQQASREEERDRKIAELEKEVARVQARTDDLRLTC